MSNQICEHITQITAIKPATRLVFWNALKQVSVGFI